ncbi:zeta toxin family protein [Levilactobacillus bambusae]|uniref:UDP-N-acetylglucosamine kinase n=1 Tax=Levilactobacillus bambusae TaxID=2024736 RepID=A0A2V1N0D2_9LACO|nr:zeta toxin family protein [Levilactobacillus bambusae]PWG00473.1 ATPase [Levilactobacillus bambusae]
MTKTEYIIIAGVNGAGKSTLFQIQPNLFAHTKRINADEILHQMHGDWRKNSDNFKAMREEVKQLHAALAEKLSIHQETTLSGTGKAQLNLINQAHKNGFKVTLLYVALDSANTAIERVQNRVSRGGHGIPTKTIALRYQQSNRNLFTIASKADKVIIYDNTDRFVKVYARENGQTIQDDLKNFPWIDQRLSHLN